MNLLKMNDNAYKPPVKMNLQFFAEEGESEGSEGAEESSGAEENGEGSDEERLELTAEELQKRIESESDRKLEKALQRKQKEWEKETEKKIQEAIEEKERLSKLSEKERKEEELTKREQEIEKKLKEIERKELRADALSDLSEKGFPSEYTDFLADTLLADDAETTLERINQFKEMTDKMLNQMKKEAFRQGTPPAGSGTKSTSKVQSLAEMRNRQAEQQKQAPNPWATN